jgi:hypothetical protein
MEGGSSLTWFDELVLERFNKVKERERDIL